MDRWELAVRERIRDVIARVAIAGDALKLDDYLAGFCPEAVLERRGASASTGYAEIRARLSGLAGRTDPGTAVTAGVPAPRVVRHSVTNVSFVSVTPEEARTDSYFTVFSNIGIDHFGRYRDRWIPFGDHWRIQHRLVTVDWYADNSAFGGGGNANGEGQAWSIRPLPSNCRSTSRRSR
jgi:hypothetical protein